MASLYSLMSAVQGATTEELNYDNDLLFVWPPELSSVVEGDFQIEVTTPVISGEVATFSLNYIEREDDFNFPNANIIFADQDLLSYLNDFNFSSSEASRSIIESIFFTSNRTEDQKLGTLVIPQMACTLDETMTKRISLNINRDYQNFKIFVSLFDESTKEGIVYQTKLFDKGDANIKSLPQMPVNFSILNFTSPLFSQAQAKLKLFEEKYLSNIYYTASPTDEMLGVFAFDMEKFLSVYAAFPSLASAIPDWSAFVLKSQVYLKKLKRPDNQVVVSTVVADCSVVKDLKVGNSSGKLFFDFSIRDMSRVTEYDLELRMLFDDRTKKIARDYITQIENNKQDKGFISATVSAFYTKEPIPMEFDALVDESVAVSDLEYQKILFDFIGEITSKLDSDKTKIVKNNKPSTAITYPKFTYPKTPLTFYDFSFLQRIRIQSNVNLNLPLSTVANYNLKASAGSTFQGATEGKNTLAKLNVKSFDLTSALELIPSFKVTNIKEILATDKLRNDKNLDINCGESDEIQEALTSITSLPKFTSLTTVAEQKYEFEYLDFLKDTVAGFVWKDLRSLVIDQLTGQQVILCRVKGHSEYYNGIFYLTGEGGF